MMPASPAASASACIANEIVMKALLGIYPVLVASYNPESPFMEPIPGNCAPAIAEQAPQIPGQCGCIPADIDGTIDHQWQTLPSNKAKGPNSVGVFRVAGEMILGLHLHWPMIR